MSNHRDEKTGRMLPGNPGKPRGARNRLQNKFVQALADDFEEHGPGVIRIVRMEEPATYLKVIVAVLPKEFIVEAREIERMSDDEIKEALEAIGKFGATPKAPEDAVH